MFSDDNEIKLEIISSQLTEKSPNIRKNNSLLNNPAKRKCEGKKYTQFNKKWKFNMSKWDTAKASMKIIALNVY